THPGVRFDSRSREHADFEVEYEPCPSRATASPWRSSLRQDRIGSALSFQFPFIYASCRCGRTIVSGMAIEQRSVQIPADRVYLDGDLAVPSSARGIVAFAHGSGSSRSSPRNRFVAEVLQEAGLATLLIDLLTRREESIDQVTGHLRFDIGLLA